MKRLANRFTASVSMAVAIATAMLFAFPVVAQDSRLSLADRVTRLEQQGQNKDQGSIGMVNQVQQLKEQLRQLQGQIEELQHQQQELGDKSKAQYLDLDSRLGRLENGGAASGAAPASAQSTTTNPSAAATAGASTSTSSSTTANSNAAPAADGANSADAQAAYGVAFKALRAGDYVSASRDFRAFIAKYPNQTLTSNAWYWLGESYYVTMNYPVALESFQKLLSQFPQSEKAPDALLKVGYSELELKHVAEAKATLTTVTTKYPGSKAASLAQERLQRLQQQSAN